METLTLVDISRSLPIPGWMEPKELEWLAEQASKRTRIVELGSFCGRSTRALAEHTSGHVTAIDKWEWMLDILGLNRIQADPWEAFHAALNDLIPEKVTPIRADHAKVPELGFEPDMVFIDGDHTYLAFRHDLLYWRDHIAPGGLLCGHDAHNPGWPDVDQVLAELMPEAKFVEGTFIWYVEIPLVRIERMAVEEVKLRGGGVALPQVIDRESAAWDVQSTRRARVANDLAVAICIPFAGTYPDGRPRYVPPEFAVALRLLQEPPNTHTATFATKGIKRDEARNSLVRLALQHKSEHVLFIDDDNPPPPDALLKLMSVLCPAPDDVALCAGIYACKHEPASPLVFQGKGTGPFWKWKAGDIFECSNIATGCMLIRTAIFKRIPEPWFKDLTTTAECSANGWDGHDEVTDDMYFCDKVVKAGYRLIAHGGVLPGHWDEHGQCFRIPEDSYPFQP